MKKPHVGCLDLVSSLIASLSAQALEVNELVYNNSIFWAKKGSIIEHRVSCRQWCRTSWDRWWGQFVFVRTSYISRPLPVTTRWAWFPNHRSNSPQDRDCREESGFKSSTSSFLVQENICQSQPKLLFPPLPLQKPLCPPFWRLFLPKGSDSIFNQFPSPTKTSLPNKTWYRWSDHRGMLEPAQWL